MVERVGNILHFRDGCLGIFCMDILQHLQGQVFTRREQIFIPNLLSISVSSLVGCDERIWWAGVRMLSRNEGVPLVGCGGCTLIALGSDVATVDGTPFNWIPFTIGIALLSINDMRLHPT